MKQEILIPTYYNKFSCIGSACEDTCCAGWKVNVDKSSFNKYRKITSGPIATNLKTNITRERKTPSDLTYAKIKMDKEGKCTFLNNEGLCKIYIELGENYLCHTCTIYPRHLKQVDHRMEKSLGTSCPEAARLILMNPEGIDFIIQEEKIDKKERLEPAVTQDFFWDIRMFAIQLLQNRNTSIEHRLIVLGMFLDKLAGTIQNEWPVKLPTYVEIYNAILDDAEQLKLLTNLPDNLSFQMDMVYKLIQHRSAYGLSSQRFIECVQDMRQGLHLNEGSSLEHSVNFYKNAYRNHYKPFFIEHSYILENYLVNYVFKNAFPRNISQIFEEYVMLVIHFLLIKLHLIGMASHYQTMSSEMAIKLIQSFSKQFEHSPVYLNEVQKELHDKQYTTMAHMIVLIKS